MRKLLGFFFGSIGISCLVYASLLTFQRVHPSPLAFALEETHSITVQSDQKPQPTILKIPALEIELPIVPAQLTDKKWEATTQGVSYLVTTPTPGETGNSVLYGHNWPKLLGNLHKIQSGQSIEIVFSDGSSQVFRVELTSVVSPNQTHVLDQTTDHRLTLYTCTGFLDTKRFVVTAISV